MEMPYGSNMSNYVRLRNLFDLAHKTIRMLFDKKYPPSTLTATLNDNRKKLDDLHSRRLLGDRQMEMLFPSAGKPPTTSKDYDLILLLELIRNLGNHDHRADSSFWNRKPPASDISGTADLARMRYYINYIKHFHTDAINDDTFDSIWKEMSAAIERLGANRRDISRIRWPHLNEEVKDRLSKILERIKVAFF